MAILRKSHLSPSRALLHPPEFALGVPAKLLGVGERYVWRMIAEQRVPIVKIGRLVRFDLAGIRQWIEEQRRPGSDTL